MEISNSLSSTNLCQIKTTGETHASAMIYGFVCFEFLNFFFFNLFIRTVNIQADFTV